jgi:hypothetical protein
MIDGIFASLKRSLDGLTKPVSLYTVDSSVSEGRLSAL